MDDQVTRSVDLDASVEDVWQAVADPAERAGWLDDEDARSRHVRVDESAPGERLVWTWWRPGDEGDASTVSVVLAPLDGGRTRLVVTERLSALASVRVESRHERTPVALSAARARLRRLWAARLVGLEVACHGSGSPVAVAGAGARAAVG
ncbi:MAG TPA: SRPBCC domain-containing protein [Acidimicrobiales bacterium]|nr:SRPBCC domain-containing protein [Acidimicrobiales bacterium]